MGCSQAQIQNQPSPQTNNQLNPVAALINGKPLHRQDLWPHLAESNGRQILEEIILTNLLDSAARSANWDITESDQQHELVALIEIINQSSDPQNTPRLIESIRTSRGLGPVRFAALLRRNAILRRMIAQDQTLQIQIDSEIQRAIDQLDSPPPPTQKDRITRRATLVAEQRAMELAARELLDNADVLVMDRSINWSGE
jgi:hypothetical protein